MRRSFRLAHDRAGLQRNHRRAREWDFSKMFGIGAVASDGKTFGNSFLQSIMSTRLTWGARWDRRIALCATMRCHSPVMFPEALQ
ncbi:hypothetical protein CCR94_21350 [Rhodoblastus sphagnicola]|uniref:Uncharacterized protein n=1 Tax=Rhodoblastus sphagnicola TaxID=333368 RepID=A0A2S6MX87_9HYPH|nr:hypothetical protein [Rhodoblastus sphagnicola]MBB4199305.1 hypothetical protein [Rhodoblastus sphagnicola]PPQ26970.1 hypothetical protein CCR94_21350 [Rhodoblastus sphagnicola]